MSRGLRNYNPLNIRKGGDTFQGEVLPSRDVAFKTFKTMPWGYRAAFVTLATYNVLGHCTIDSIIKRWAPESENDTEAYIKSVVSRSKVKRDKLLTLKDGASYVQIVAAMSFVENGIPANMHDVEEGFKLQTRIVK